MLLLGDVPVNMLLGLVARAPTALASQWLSSVMFHEHS